MIAVTLRVKDDTATPALNRLSAFLQSGRLAASHRFRGTEGGPRLSQR